MKNTNLWDLIKKHLTKKSTLFVIIALCLLSLRVINWFEYPNILISGDFRPPLNEDAFMKRVVYTWDETDLGMPSIYSPRILSPFYFFVSILQFLGINLYFSQMVAVFFIYFLSSVLMFIFVKTITNDGIASFMAALFLTANIFLINDREVTGIGFLETALMVLPFLIFFNKGIKSKSQKLMAISGVLFTFSFATFPNYRTTLIGLILLFLLLLFNPNNGISLNSHDRLSLRFSISYESLKLLLIFLTTFILASIWVFAIIYLNSGVLIEAYRELATPWFIGGREIHYVLRLIARWGFDSGDLGMPYIPYNDVFLYNPLMVFLSFLPAIMAFASLLLSKEKKLTIFFGVVAIFFLALASGLTFIKYGDSIYFDLMSLPLLKSFREASNWIFFIVICFGILIGCTVSGLCRKIKKVIPKILVVCTVAALLLYISYPITTGDVSRNWLKPEIKGSHLPDSYTEINDMLPNNYWTVLLPQRSIYVVYNFSGTPFACGNPYPLVFSKPIISGTGTEYIRSGNLELIYKIYDHIQRGFEYKNVAPEGKVKGSSNETGKFTPENTIDGRLETRWSSQQEMPQWLEIEWDTPQTLSKINILFESAYAEEYFIEAWNGSGWELVMEVKNNTSIHCEHFLPQPLNTTKIRFYFTKATTFGSVSVWELETYTQIEATPKFLGLLGIKYLVVEKELFFGTFFPVNSLRVQECQSFKLIKEWDEIDLFENTYGVQKIYVADNFFNFTDIVDMFKVIEKSEWNTLNHSAFVDQKFFKAEFNDTFTLPDSFVWSESSPTSYEVTLQSNGPFILVLLESYDPHWKLSINGKPIQEDNHFEVNSFANGWLITETGYMTLTIEYESQKILTTSAITSAILPLFLLLVLSRAEVKKISHKLYYKLKCLSKST